MGIGTRVAGLRRVATCEKAAARLVDCAGMGRGYKVMGVTGGVGGGTEDVWPFKAGEVRPHCKECKVDHLATLAQTAPPPLTTRSDPSGAY
jgi:hypothetical protein